MFKRSRASVLRKLCVSSCSFPRVQFGGSCSSLKVSIFIFDSPCCDKNCALLHCLQQNVPFQPGRGRAGLHMAHLLNKFCLSLSLSLPLTPLCAPTCLFYCEFLLNATLSISLNDGMS